MKLFPSYSLFFNSNLTVIQLSEKFKERIDLEDYKSFSSKENHKKYYGTFKDNIFEIQRRIYFRNSFQPKIYITIKEQKNSSIISIVMRLDKAVQYFFYLWCAVTMFAFFAIIRSSIIEKAFNPIIVLPLFALIFFYGIMYIGFLYESTKSSEDLSNLVKKIDGCQ